MQQQTPTTEHTTKQDQAAPETVTHDKREEEVEEEKEEEDSEDESPEFEDRPRPVYGGTTWSKEDRSYENIRRPPFRPNRVPIAVATPESRLKAKEAQLQDEEEARRRKLEGRYSETEIRAMLTAEYGERRRVLASERDALMGKRKG